MGYTRNFKQILPGEYTSQLPSSNHCSLQAEEEDDAEGMPTTSLPPYEPLVLWRSTEPEPQPESDLENKDVTENGEAPVPAVEYHKVEVIPELASKLRPHQREGVQFLFDCTMGLRSFDGQV